MCINNKSNTSISNYQYYIYINGVMIKCNNFTLMKFDKLMFKRYIITWSRDCFNEPIFINIETIF